MLNLWFDHSNVWRSADRSLLGMDGDSHDRTIGPRQLGTGAGSAGRHIADSHSDAGDPRLVTDADFTPGPLTQLPQH
jgi:hypothetical protein